jgi:hypothetical protein
MGDVMIEALLSLSTLPGCLVFTAFTTAVGIAIYYATFRLNANRHSDEALKEIKDATENLFRVAGWLFTLLLSLTFTDVVGELSVTENAIESEAVAIEDVHHNLRRFASQPVWMTDSMGKPLA